MKNRRGITLIALVITVIVMLILAGVSLNAIVGDNGIITNAQNANIESGMAALEEWLQQKYVEYYESATDDDNENKVAFLNRMFTYQLLLKDGTREYVINSGKMYYLLNKNCSYIPKEVRDGLSGGNSTEYSDYSRLIDVYGITKDLKVYYCSNGIEERVYGNIKTYEVDPNASASGINSNDGLKRAISDTLADKYGITVDDELGVTLSNAAVFSDSLEIDGSIYSGITEISGLGDLKNLKRLTLSNMSLESLRGIEGITNIEYLFLNNTTVGNFSNLTNCIELTYLYICLSNTIETQIANNQVNLLGDGLKNAQKLTKLEYFGISGVTTLFVNYPSYIENWYDNTHGNVSDISGLSKFNDILKKNIKYLYLNNNSIASISSLEDFAGVIRCDLMFNASLTSLNGFGKCTNMATLHVQYCDLENLNGISNCIALSDVMVFCNSRLSSLGNNTTNTGLSNAKNLTILRANNCNITDITALDSKKLLYYLNLSNNVALEKVSTLGTLTGLTKLFLNDNTNMDMMEIDENNELIVLTGVDSLNTTYTNSNNITKTIISQCPDAISNMPQKYADLFITTSTNLDYSYAKRGSYLQSTDAAWVKLKGRTDLVSLNLSGQTQLSPETLQDVLPTLTGLKHLGLNGLTNISNLNFACTYELQYNGDGSIKRDSDGYNVYTYTPILSKLIFLDLRSINSSLIDLTALNGLIKLKTLVVNNDQIKFETMQDALNRFDTTYGVTSPWLGSTGSTFGGIILSGANKTWDFSKCIKLTRFTSAGYGVSTGQKTDIIDLSKCTRLTTVFFTWNYQTLICGPKTTRIDTDGNNTCNVDLKYVTQQYDSNGNKIQLHLQLCRPSNASFEAILTSLKNDVDTKVFDTCSTLTSINFSAPYVRYFSSQPAMSSARILDLNGLKNWTRLEELQIMGGGYRGIIFYDANASTNYYGNSTVKIVKLYNVTNTNLNGINRFTNLERLYIESTEISDVSGLEDMLSLKHLSITHSHIVNLVAIGSLKNIDMKNYNTDGTVSSIDNFSLASNNIVNIGPLLNMRIDANSDGKLDILPYTGLVLSWNNLGGDMAQLNISVLKELCDSGLKYVNISNNGFTANEVSEIQQYYSSHGANAYSSGQ